MAELHLLSTGPSAERQLDVVFVHGLGGNWQGTWGNGAEEGDSWPHWLAAEPELPIGVWSLSYPASSSRWEWFKAVIQAKVCGERRDPEAGAAMALPRRAANVLDRLALAGIGQRPVVFIAHSLGGLLVKSVLRLAAESPDAPERRRVVEQTRAVMFVATPHQGSSLATLATAIKVYLPSVSVRDLRANDAHLNALFLWYRSYAPRHNILTRSYVENQATNGVVVVTASSADPGVTGPTARDPVPLDRNHVEICRPRDRGDQLVLGSVELIRQILQGNPTHPAQSVPAAAGDRAVVVVQSFAPQGNADSDEALVIDLTDLFDDRLPIDNEVWSRAIPERIAAALPAIAELPQPVVLAPQAHLSIAWFLGTLLNPKRGIRVNVRQRGMGGKSIWDVCQAQDPAGGGGWQWSVEALNRGPELALVVSATHDALADARRSIDALALPIGRLVHGTLPVPGYEAVVDGGHARWLADELVRHVQELVVADPPRRLHLFAACPATLMVLLGQRASVLGPTTAYEFLLEDGSRRYVPGMATPGASG